MFLEAHTARLMVVRCSFWVRRRRIRAHSRDFALVKQIVGKVRAHCFRCVAGNVPTAEFVTTPAEKIDSSTEITPNYLLRGTSTLRGIGRSLEFPVLIAAKDYGQHLTGQGVLEFDHTAYDFGKLIRSLGSHLINEHIHLHVKIHADGKHIESGKDTV